MSKVRKDVRKFDEEVDISFDIDGKEYIVKFKPFFDNQGIKKIMKELKTNLDKFKEYKVEFDDELLVPLIAYFTIKNYSDLITPNIKDYKKEETYYKADLQFFIDLFNGDYIKTITEYFIESEWAKVNNAIEDIMVLSEKMNRDVQKMQEEMQNLDLKSPEVRDRIQNKTKQIPEV